MARNPVAIPKVQIPEKAFEENGKLAAEQEAWLDALREVPGIEVYCWRPSDWDTILEVLR